MKEQEITTPIYAYQKEILRLLRVLWKRDSKRMWSQIYTLLVFFAERKEAA